VIPSGRMPLFNPIVRIALFSIISFALILLFSFIALLMLVITGQGIAPEQRFEPKQMLALTCFSYVPVLIAILICRNLLDRASFLSLGLEAHRGWQKHLFAGFLGGFTMAAVSFIGCLATGVARDLSIHVAPIKSFLFYFACLCFQSGMEELTMRGYILQNLLTRYRETSCIVTTSVLFSALHLVNFTITPSIPFSIIVVAMLNITLFGCLMALVYVRTKMLWAAIGLHWGWNFSTGFIFGSPVSGLKFDDSMLSVKWAYDSPLSGGAFGLEGSIVVTTLLCLAIIWLSRASFEAPTAWWERVKEAYEQRTPAQLNSNIICNEVEHDEHTA